MNSPHKILSLSLCCLSLSILPELCFAQERVPSPHEALLLKRIVEYWKDEDYALAKKQIVDFLAKYEDSTFRDHLMTMLGDLYFNEKNYNEAIASYTQITQKEFLEKSYLKHLKSLFELNEYAAVEKMANKQARKQLEQATESEIQTTLMYADALYRQNKVIEALPYFQGLEKTKYRTFSLLPLAEGYRATKDYKSAVAAYRALLEERADKKSDILFQIATLESEYDTTSAAHTFLETALMKREHCSVAAYNFLALSFESKRFDEIIEHSAEILALLADDRIALGRYYVGCAFFAKKDYLKAIPALEAYVKEEDLASPYLKTALLNLIICSRETEDTALSDRVLKSLATHFASDPAYLQSFLVKMHIQKEEGTLALNSSELKTILELSTEFDGREKIVYDVALMLLDDAKWVSAREIFELYIQQYPTGPRCTQAYRHLLNTSIDAMKNDPASTDHKELFVADLQKVLHEENVLSDTEEQEYRLSLTKTLYELGRPPEALKAAEDFLAHYPTHEKAFEAHLMAALCAKEGGADPLKAAMHLERSLFLNPEQPDAHLLHLQLFNSYLSLSEKEEEKKETYLDQASDHLYLAFMIKKDAVSFDNQVWLANHYYAKVKNSQDESSLFEEDFIPLKRSLATFEKVLGFESGIVSFPKHSDLSLLEGEALKYADLLTYVKNAPQKIALLEMLTQLSAENSTVPWKYQKKALFELAQAYEFEKNAQKALEIYNRLLDHHTPSQLTLAAQLQKTKLQFATLSKDEKDETSPAVIDILNELKDLQIKKQLQCEPIHLEAALEYISVREALCSEESKAEKRLFYLTRMKNDFLSDEDIIGKEYLEARNTYPEQNKLFEQYMSFVDAEMNRLQSLQARKAGNGEEADALCAQAIAKLQALLKEKDLLTPTLLDRVLACQQQIQETS